MGKATVGKPGLVSGPLRKRVGSRKSRPVVGKTIVAAFDPKAFLAKVGEGTAISKYQKGQTVFAQGEVATLFFTSRRARLSSLSFLRVARRQSSASSGQTTFLAKGVLMAIRYASRQRSAIDECLITRITKAAMIATMHDEPKFSELFMADLIEPEQSN